MQKKLTRLFLLLSLLVLSSCVTTPQIIYKDVPVDYVIIKRATLDKLVDELTMTRHDLLECWERERVRKD